MYFEMSDYANSKKIFDGLLNQYKTRDEIDYIAFKTGIAYREKGVEYEKPFNFVVENKPSSDLAGEVCVIRGDDAFKNKDYTSAEKWYKKFLLFPNRENAGPVFLYRLISLYRIDKHAEVVRAVKEEKSVAMDDFTEKLVHFWEGKSLYKLGRIKEAYSILKDYDVDYFSDEDLSALVKISLHEKDVKKAGRAASVLMRNPQRCAEANFEIGKFFIEREEPLTARDYFIGVVQKYPDSPQAPHARMELAELDFRGGKIESALEALSSVELPSLNDRKTALRIACLVRLNKADEADEIAEKNMQLLKTSSYGELAFRENMKYYYVAGREEKFKKYAGLLRKYPGNGPLVEYYTAKFEFNTGAYQNAFYSFYKLSASEHEFRREALYHVGVLSFHKQANTAQAMKYFEKLAKDERTDDVFVQKAMLFLAIDAHSKADDTAAEKYLSRIIGSASRESLTHRAMNLYEYFGFYDKQKGKK
jgi:outer membrane protein assembly factor BamD (BamD/ComL family)